MITVRKILAGGRAAMCIQITTVASRIFNVNYDCSKESNIAYGNEIIGSVPHNTRQDISVGIETDVISRR